MSEGSGAVRAPGGQTQGGWTPPGTLPTMIMIARRAALESLRDRMTTWMSAVFALVLPASMVLGTIRPMAARAGDEGALGTLMATYLLLVGLLPSSASVGIAAGQFAGEKETGNLAPLLASPASNAAIFGGKVLGAVAPALLFAAVAELTYLGSIAAFVGADRLRLLPIALGLGMLALVPGVAIFAATVASLISSRVRTFNAAQQLAGLALIPVWIVLIGLAFRARDLGAPAVLAAVVALLFADALLIALAAATWRREEVLARR